MAVEREPPPLFPGLSLDIGPLRAQSNRILEFLDPSEGSDECM